MEAGGSGQVGGDGNLVGDDAVAQAVLGVSVVGHLLGQEAELGAGLEPRLHLQGASESRGSKCQIFNSNKSKGG